MSYIDQFVASVSFNTEKVITFRKQSAWKTILYILVFVMATGVINTFLTWDFSLKLLRETWMTSGFDVADEELIRFTHTFMSYLMISFDLILHFILISVIAYAGIKGYKTMGEVKYKEAWNVTAYGITAPILVRLVVQGLGLELRVMTIAYWGAMMLFSMMCLKKIVNLEK
jgi:hypothetical protein